MTRSPAAVDARHREEILTLSPHGIGVFEACKAGYFYTYQLLPRMETLRAREVTRTGRVLHTLAALQENREHESALLEHESQAVRHEVREMLDRLRERYYYTYPARTEVPLSLRIRGCGVLHGIADRISEDGNRVLIVDYKTAAQPNPLKDKAQLLAYATMLCRLEDIRPESVTLVLDYLRTDELYEFPCSLEEMKHFEHYLIHTFRTIREWEAKYRQNPDIGRIPHTPGECSFCPMLGRCKAYRLIVHPRMDTNAIDECTTASLVEEYVERERIRKMNDERLKALKQALLSRHEAGDTEVSRGCTVVNSAVTVYPTEAVLARILPELVRAAISDVKYHFVVNTAALTEAIKRLLLSMTPENLKRNDLPEEYREFAESVRMKIPRDPYLKLRTQR